MSFEDGEMDGLQHELNEPLIPLDPGVNQASPKRSKGFFSKAFIFLFEIYTNQSGNPFNIASGLFIALVLGTVVGLKLPKNVDLPTVWYRSISSIIGYTYFFSWSVSVT
jgi:hypothetical protein